MKKRIDAFILNKNKILYSGIENNQVERYKKNKNKMLKFSNPFECDLKDIIIQMIYFACVGSFVTAVALSSILSTWVLYLSPIILGPFLTGSAFFFRKKLLQQVQKKRIKDLIEEDNKAILSEVIANDRMSLAQTNIMLLSSQSKEIEEQSLTNLLAFYETNKIKILKHFNKNTLDEYMTFLGYNQIDIDNIKRMILKEFNYEQSISVSLESCNRMKEIIEFCFENKEKLLAIYLNLNLENYLKDKYSSYEIEFIKSLIVSQIPKEKEEKVIKRHLKKDYIKM